ncbi:uncharacterized protein J4E84_009731 [Alternaria hordeiaustralica]|uniref:uncharacterized protein n=1 Tax=Alternaria hordeiaustralica TaxID=1187925 RepID=UPI0020C22FF6|nr:uncharacterized protein J4E84_009731 [Alternaria hordeiaustralica]KAI4676114.1 hypothetical protein J4E84_009731 [Alternaria hordeiaustralica]
MMNTSTSLQKAYTFHPTELNRRIVPENKAPYRFNFGPWCGSTIEDLVYYGPQQYAGKRYLLTFILSEKFDLKSKVDLITAFRSLGDSFYQDLFCVGQKMTERGFTRTWRHGSHYYSQQWEEDKAVLLSCDETKYDQFIHVSGPRPSDWDRAENATFGGGQRRSNVTLDAAAFKETIFSDLDEVEREELTQFPVHISFHGMPIRLERLFIDNPEKKATYLTIAPLGFDGSSGGQDIYLTMRLNEQGQDEDWAEKLLGIPHHFFGAYINSETEDLACAKIKLIQESEIEGGFRFEAHGNVVPSKDEPTRIELDWGNHSMIRKYGSIESLHLEYSEEGQGLPDSPCHIRGVITLRDNLKFKWREERLEDAVWRCCALELDRTR